MFNKTSMGGWGLTGFIVFTALALMGFDVGSLPEDISQLNLAQIATIVLWAIGQYRRGDLRFGLFRKEV